MLKSIASKLRPSGWVRNSQRWSILSSGTGTCRTQRWEESWKILSLVGILVLSPASGSPVRAGDEEGKGEESSLVEWVSGWSWPFQEGKAWIRQQRAPFQRAGVDVLTWWLSPWVSLGMGPEPRPGHMCVCLALRRRSPDLGRWLQDLYPATSFRLELQVPLSQMGPGWKHPDPPSLQLPPQPSPS